MILGELPSLLGLSEIGLRRDSPPLLGSAESRDACT